MGVSNVTVTNGVQSGNGLITVTYTSPVDPAQLVSNLQGTVTGFRLPKGLTTALNSKLNAVLDALDADDTAGACDSLQAFVNQVNAQTGKKLTAGQAASLLTQAQNIESTLGC